MTRYRIILSNIVFSLQLILLLLLLFYHQVTVPEWLMSAGRFHPLLLHFPITLLLLLLIILFFRSHWKHLQGFDELFGIILLHAVLFATVTAISGIILSTENDYDPALLTRHRWLGGATAIISYLCWLVYMRPGISFRLFQVMMLICTALLVIGSHNGGILTHGEDYLTIRSKNDLIILKKPATDSSSVYEAAIQPLLEARCYSCHNEKKAKGNFVMTQNDRFLKGGKEGIPWKPGEPENSLLIKRLLLDAEDKKHMPPKGKTQLTETEISLLHQWIGKGASFEKAFRDYPAIDSFRIFASSFSIPQDDIFFEPTVYTFKSADPDIISKLNNPYRSITPKNKRSPALLLTFYVSQQFKPEMLEECKPLSQQVISINLSKMPLEDDGLKTIAQFENLEELILNGTKISGATLYLLESCKKLEILSLANTKVSFKSIEGLGKLSSLKKVYLWQSGLSQTEINTLSKKFPEIYWDHGTITDSSEILKLTTPLINNPEKTIFNDSERLVLRHPMPGVSILFTLDGNDPDTTSSTVYQEPITISGPTKVKARAIMPGWYASEINEWALYSTGIKSSEAVLLSSPDPKHALQGGKSLIDGNKAESNNLMVNWLGFRNNSCKARFRFNQADSISTVVLSMANNHASYIFPPQSVTILGGKDTNHLKPIGRLIPVQPAKYGKVGNQAYSVPVKKGIYKYILVEVNPVISLPLWHSGKKERGWIFIDEVFFY